MRMPGPDADPDYFRPAFHGKRAEADERKKEWSPRNGAELFGKLFLNFRADAAEERKGEMHLARLKPADAADVGIELSERARCGILQLDADEETFQECYTPTAISAGDLSAAGFLNEKANTTPMKQSAEPAKNGV